MESAKPEQSTPLNLVVEALDFIQTNSIKRQEIDWQSLRAEVLSEARAFESLSEAHSAIKHVLKLLNDNHSFLWTPEGMESRKEANHPGFRLHQNEPVVIDVFPDSPAEQKGVEVGDKIRKVNSELVNPTNWSRYFAQALEAGTPLTLFKVKAQEEIEVVLASGFAAPDPPPVSFRTPSGFGLIDLPGHSGDGTLGEKGRYAEIVSKGFYDLEAQGVKAWIIDLRRNDGGNMWFMLAGLTPLLGKGIYGSFVDPVEGNDWVWHFDGEVLGCYKKADMKADYVLPVPNFRPLENPDAPVAVLTSGVTSSSGELVLIAHLGRPKTKMFGSRTGGLTSSNGMKQLADGSQLFVMGHWGAARSGHLYKNAIEPDVSVPIDWSSYGTASDPVILAAEAWLQEGIET